jgi:hypothetical protein
VVTVEEIVYDMMLESVAVQAINENSNLRDFKYKYEKLADDAMMYIKLADTARKNGNKVEANKNYIKSIECLEKLKEGTEEMYDGNFIEKKGMQTWLYGMISRVGIVVGVKTFTNTIKNFTKIELQSYIDMYINRLRSCM